MKDLRQTAEYAKFLSLIGWKPMKVNGLYFFLKKLSFVGSAIKFQRSKELPMKEIEKLAQRYRAFQIIIEPEVGVKTKVLFQNNFKLSKNPYLATKTLQIDITQTLPQIIAQMKKDGRYSLRKSEKIKVYEADSISEFRDDWFNVVRHKRHILPLSHMKAFQKAFGPNMILLENKEGTAGGMFLIASGIAYYWIGFTSDLARNSLVQYQIIWNGILWAKKRGAKVFDFEGIYDERFPLKGWQGFTHFKKSFGGREITYPGSFLKWRLPI